MTHRTRRSEDTSRQISKQYTYLLFSDALHAIEEISHPSNSLTSNSRAYLFRVSLGPFSNDKLDDLTLDPELFPSMCARNGKIYGSRYKGDVEIIYKKWAWSKVSIYMLVNRLDKWLYRIKSLDQWTKDWFYWFQRILTLLYKEKRMCMLSWTLNYFSKCLFPYF